MSADMISVLLVEDNPGDARLIQEQLKDAVEADIRLQAVGRLEAGFNELDKNAYDVLLLDLMLPDSSGIDTVVKAHAHCPEIPIVLLTGVDDEAIGLKAIKLGAQDYLVKGKADADLLIRSLRYAFERGRAEDALRSSEQRFRSVAEHASEGIVVLNRGGLITYWNKAAERIFGYVDEEIAGEPMRMLFPENRHKAYELVIDPTMGNEDVWVLGRTIEEEGTRKNGATFPMVLSLATWQVSGERFFSALIRDMTEIWEAKQRTNLQERLAAVGQLASGIAHDFNNILGTITLFTETMEKTAGLAGKDLERLGMIRQQAYKAAALIRQILDFSRRSVMEIEPMDFVAFLRSICRLLERALPSNILISLNCDEERYVVRGDPTRLEQMIMNLAVNARDAMPDGGKLGIHLSRFTTTEAEPPVFRDMPPGAWLRLEVSDSGTGISPDALPHIFEPFFTTKPIGEGTGLGLAQVYGIVKQHEGYIDVKSDPGRGTSFIIYLPSLEGPTGDYPAAADQVPSAVGAGERILVVDDDPATRQAITEALEDMGFGCLLASDGSQALEILDRQRDSIDLVLSDLVMPGMGGDDLYGKIRLRFPELPIVLMTGHPGGKKLQSLLESGDVLWIQKPLDSETLFKAIRRTLP